MTQSTKFGTLDDVALVEAWAHEARDFTPWLAENLERLSSAIGIPLELTGTEMPVESFAADILARNTLDDSVVLIENQFRASDHGHLGQVLTYLAGSDAKTIVWIAPTFREPHRSAVRWLNQNTSGDFAFFAVRLRVVRIGDSPMAPVFEVLERPNNWDRQVQELSRTARESTALGDFRLAFWSLFLKMFPAEELGVGPASRASGRWRLLPKNDLVIVQYLMQGSVGVYVRGKRGTDPEDTISRLAPFAETLGRELNADFNEEGNFLFVKSLTLDMQDQSNWNRAATWLKSETDKYVRVLKEVVK